MPASQHVLILPKDDREGMFAKVSQRGSKVFDVVVFDGRIMIRIASLPVITNCDHLRNLKRVRSFTPEQRGESRVTACAAESA